MLINGEVESLTPDEWLQRIGEQVCALRVQSDLNQGTLAAQAGVSVRALSNLERGYGSALETLVLVLRALGRSDWLGTLAAQAVINPLSLTRDALPRRRVRHPRKTKG